MKFQFYPIDLEEDNLGRFTTDDFCVVVIESYKKFYPRVGFIKPWIGYFVLIEDAVVGVGGFKGSPKKGKVEIGYGVVPASEGQGIATQICKRLTDIALNEDPDIKITARTLMIENASTAILKKNGFVFKGEVTDREDGQVWEWVYEL